LPDYRDWLGRERRTDSAMDPWPARALRATIGSDRQEEAGGLPLLWQWLYFLETPNAHRLGRDGHARKGDFLPPIEQPRRMFVGGRSRIDSPLELGEPAELRETILRCEPKQGRDGPMNLLTVGYRYHQGGRLCISEERDLMYLPDRDGPVKDGATVTSSPVPQASMAKDLPTDPVLLFRFSALTFNGHRIHYDSDYARDVEGYPERVVHGPLTALLLAEMAAERAGPLRSFSFRARAPLFAGDRLRLRGETVGDRIELAAYRPDGQVAMTAEAER
jgi:3-methylfumaryl-CoA hydratase